jgi:Domain of unknown function (DUF5069)
MFALDLNKQAPSSPRTRTGGYVILARMADKGRSEIAVSNGGYHYDCPLDNYLFDFKGVTGGEVRKLLENGDSNEDIANWLDANGTPKSHAEVIAWSDAMEAHRPYDNPEKKDWFVGVCAEAGIDPAQSTIFDYLEADDKVTFAS